jgi:hypothetical protein
LRTDCRKYEKPYKCTDSFFDNWYMPWAEIQKCEKYSEKGAKNDTTKK